MANQNFTTVEAVLESGQRVNVEICNKTGHVMVTGAPSVMLHIPCHVWGERIILGRAENPYQTKHISVGIKTYSDPAQVVGEIFTGPTPSDWGGKLPAFQIIEQARGEHPTIAVEAINPAGEKIPVAKAQLK